MCYVAFIVFDFIFWNITFSHACYIYINILLRRQTLGLSVRLVVTVSISNSKLPALGLIIEHLTLIYKEIQYCSLLKSFQLFFQFAPLLYTAACSG